MNLKKFLIPDKKKLPETATPQPLYKILELHVTYNQLILLLENIN